MNIATEMITGGTISEAWMRAVQAVDEMPARTTCHLVTRIARPTEQSEIRTAADDLTSQLGYPTIETVANTIFPEELARACRDHTELGHRYRTMYPTLRSLVRANRDGTYFGRLVSFPSPSGKDFDQLADLIRKLQAELQTDRPKSTRYELSLEEVCDSSSTPADDDHGLPLDTADDGTNPTLPTEPIYVPGRDRSAMGFPCLSFCSFQLDHSYLHLIAHYRRQYLVRRGYGNYLGLARLLRYVSSAAGIEPGQMMIVAGAATVDAPRYRIVRLLRQATPAEAIASTRS